MVLRACVGVFVAIKNTTEHILSLIHILFIGIVIGAVVTAYAFRRNFVGTLRVDQSDPTDAPYLFLEIEKGMGDISRKKYVLLRVNTESYIPHD